MSKHISQRRKIAHYIGLGLIAAGFLLFFSVFITAAMHFGDFSDFEERGRSSMFRAFGGMGLIVIGAVIQAIGSRGWSGSGVMLNPEQARQELEPYSRMAGGMVKDALDEAGIRLGGKPEKVVMVKCPACGKLNEDDSKFCQECGKNLQAAPATENKHDL